MSGASEIGIRISLEGGKEAATQAAAVADSLKGVGDAARSAGAGAVEGSGGIDTMSASLGKLDSSGLVAGTSLGELDAMSKRTAVDMTLLRGEVDTTLTGIAKSEATLTVNTGFLAGALNGLGLDGAKLAANFETLGKYSALAVAAVGAVVTYETAKMALGFDNTTTSIAATADMSEKSASTITNAFLHTTDSVTFNAQQMATAFQPISGQLQSITHGALDAQSSMIFMNAAMNLSTASGEALGITTASVADILQAYSLGVGKAAYVSNILFNTSRLTATSTTELASTMDSLHARLGQVVPSLADTSGLLYDLAQHGVSGSRGTRMATGALETLLSGSVATNSMLSVLGISLSSFYGPNGKFIGMANAIGILQPALAGLTTRNKLLAESALFGAGAAEAMGKTVLAGPAAYDKYRAAVTKHNAVEQAAAKVTKSLDGEIKLLEKDVHNMGITIGQFVLPKLVAIGKWMMNNKPIVIALAVVIGGVLVAAVVAWVASLFTLTGVLLAVGLAMDALPFVVIVAALVFLYANWHKIWADIKIDFDMFWGWFKGILRNDFVLYLLGPIGWLIFLGQHWKTIWNGMKDVVQTVWNSLKPIFDKLKEGLHLIGDAVHAVGGFFGGAGHMLGFAEGGVVPGPQGAPMLAMVHGGEVITPPQNIYNATNSAMSPVMLGQAVSKIAPGNANSSAVPSQVIANAAGGPGQPIVIQLVVDRRVLAELVYTEMQQSYARR